MPRPNTETTEISVGFGILQIDPTSELDDEDIRRLFGSSLQYSKYLAFAQEFVGNQKYYRRLYDIGLNLRTRYPDFRGSSISRVKWEGSKRQAGTVSMPKDLIVVNTAISIKDNSDVVNNTSPPNLFERVPQGLPDISHTTDNWFNVTAADSYQRLYAFAREVWGQEYPATAVQYHKQTTEETRKIFRARIRGAKGTREFSRYQELFAELSQEVSTRTADIFNEHYRHSQMNKERIAVNQAVIRELFRMSETPYILCGIDHKTSFAVEIPDLSTWVNGWRIKNLEAAPDTSIRRGQPVVKLFLSLEHKAMRKLWPFTFRVEIRWSHGRFCGNPEAKVYKEFKWFDVPFVKLIFGRGRYQKARLIGDGGFGTVYEAINNASKETVALKELSGSVQDLHEAERFAREVQIQSDLGHPNIVPVLDRDLDAKPPWFVMPLAKCNLLDLVEESDRVPDVAVVRNTMLQVADGLDHAHRHGIIHRDVKPENILLYDNDVVKLCDFGLGKRINPDSPDWGLTASNEALGTIQYMAPEQLRSSANADARSDIYSFGKVLYHCSTGKVPYPELDLSLVATKIAAIIRRCTQDDPAERYQSTEELLLDLRTL